MGADESVASMDDPYDDAYDDVAVDSKEEEEVTELVLELTLMDARASSTRRIIVAFSSSVITRLLASNTAVAGMGIFSSASAGSSTTFFGAFTSTASTKSAFFSTTATSTVDFSLCLAVAALAILLSATHAAAKSTATFFN